MNAILTVAGNAWQENQRGRFFHLAMIFGGMMIYLSFLLGLMASDQELRVLLDSGIAFIELIALAGAVYGAATGLIKEMETKTVYLILTRPVSRSEYLLGRFLGQMMAVLASMLIMSSIHLLLLFMKGWVWQALYLKAFLGIFLKVFITTALASFAALFSTSVLSGLTMTSILWTLGHVLPEIRFLIAHRARHETAAPLLALSYLIPNLQLFNFRDRIDRVAIAPPEAFLGTWLLYSALYAGAWLILACYLLRKKEF